MLPANEFAPADRDEIRLLKTIDDEAARLLQRVVLDRLSHVQVVRLNGSAVTAISFAGVQVLLSALNRSEDVTIHEPSDALKKAFGDLALTLPQHSKALGKIETQETPNADAAPSASAARAARILTIDDSKTIRQMLLMTLQEASFEVLQAVDGQDGIEVLARENVDVVITDINMPRMDGYEVIRQLRAMPQHQGLPILVLTTESEGDKKNLARDLGATGWVVKPFDPERLVAAIRAVCQPMEA